MHVYQMLDLLALRNAHRINRRNQAIMNSNLSGTWTELLYRNKADFTALATFTSEASLLAGQNQQPTIPANFFDQFPQRSFGLRARGVLSTTGTPTFQFTVRLNSTIGSANLAGPTLGISAAITTQSGVTTKFWELWMDFVVTTAGQGSGNSTIAGAGMVVGPTAFASPFMFAMQATTPESATWTNTFDDSVSQYLNLSATCSASSASNTITCKQLLVWGYN